MIIGLAVVLIVGVILAFALKGGGKDSPDGPVTVTTPTSTSSGDPSPDPDPTTTDPKPSPSPTETEEGPSGQTVTLKNGVKVTVPSGWTIKADSDKGIYALTDSSGNALYLQAFKPAKSTAKEEVLAYLGNLEKQMTATTLGGTKQIQGPASLDIAEGVLKGTMSSSSGSRTVMVDTVMVLKTGDQNAVMLTALVDPDADLTSFGKAFNQALSEVADQMK